MQAVARGRHRSPMIGLVAAGLLFVACGHRAEPPVESAASPEPAGVDDDANAWSPDGSHILFTRYFADGNTDLFLVAVDGSELRRVTDRPGKDENGSFTPDGRFVTFCSDREGQEEIYRLSLATGEIENLTRHPAKECE